MEKIDKNLTETNIIKNYLSSQCAQHKAMEKDENIVKLIIQKINTLSNLLISSDFTYKNQKLINIFTKGIYFFLTTGQTIKTL